LDSLCHAAPPQGDGFQFPSNAKNSWAFILARLKPDVTVTSAQAEIDGLTPKMIEAFPPMDIGLPGFGKESVRLKALKDARTSPELKKCQVETATRQSAQ
jgi:hypothetical protein